MFLVADVTNPPTETLWNAILCGGSIVNVNFVSQGEAGVCQSFHPALASHRIIWMTQNFVQQHDSFATHAYHRRRVLKH